MQLSDQDYTTLAPRYAIGGCRGRTFSFSYIDSVLGYLQATNLLTQLDTTFHDHRNDLTHQVQ